MDLGVCVFLGVAGGAVQPTFDMVQFLWELENWSPGVPHGEDVRNENSVHNSGMSCQSDRLFVMGLPWGLHGPTPCSRETNS